MYRWSYLVLVGHLVILILAGCAVGTPPGTSIVLATPPPTVQSPTPAPTAVPPTKTPPPMPSVTPIPPPTSSATAPRPSPSPSPSPSSTPTRTRVVATRPPQPTNTPASAAQGAACGSRTAGALSAEAAAGHIGEVQTVEFQVVSTNNTGKVVYLNSHDPFQGHFYVAIFPDRWGEFPQPPEEYFKQRCVAVQGKIELYRGTPQIVLKAASDIRIIP